MEKQRTYLCIDMKSFFASVECAERGLSPFETNLVVADESRGKGAITLAITPKMKALGVRNRCRLFEIPKNIDYIIALPHMSLYIKYCADIFDIYLDYFSPDDIHQYSIDEAFIDVTDYLSIYKLEPKQLAKKIINEIAKRTHIPATCGIGTNLYLAKIALDITAKHCKDHIGMLDEQTFKETLWEHRPITDFWNINIEKIKPFYKNQQQKDDVIISASPEFLLAPICKTLKINYLMASVVDEHTGKYSGINCHGEEKVRRYREMFGDTKIHEFYSDSYSDTPLAKISEKAFIVKGNRLLDWDFSK